MTGFDIYKTRRLARVNQRELAAALKLKGGRGTLTDIENGLVEVSPLWACMVIAKIHELGQAESAAA